VPCNICSSTNIKLVIKTAICHRGFPASLIYVCHAGRIPAG
jgi:hypothetical protein